MARVRFGVVTLVMWFLAIEAIAQDGPPAAAPAQKQVVAATVAGEPIYVGEVTRPLSPIIQRNNLVGRDRAIREAQFLSQLIRQRLIMMYLAKSGEKATKYDVDQVIKKYGADLAARNTTLLLMAPPCRGCGWAKATATLGGSSGVQRTPSRRPAGPGKSMRMGSPAGVLSGGWTRRRLGHRAIRPVRVRVESSAHEDNDTRQPVVGKAQGDVAETVARNDGVHSIPGRESQVASPHDHT